MTSPFFAGNPVLIVEDTPELGKMMLEMIKRMGLEAYWVETGDEANAFLNTTHPCLILLDLNLPDANGWQILKHAKSRYGEHSIPVIVTTANSDNMNRAIGKLEYISRYLVKPFTLHEFKQAVFDALNLEWANI